MRRNRWSGLAPTVDAHIAYWARADRSVNTALVITDGTYEGEKVASRIVGQAMADPHLHRWIVFGSSYGLPDEHGIPQVIVQERPPLEEGGDPLVAIKPLEGTSQTRDHVGPKVLVSDGSTISGREQFHAEGAAVLQGLNLAIREHTMLKLATTHYVSAEVMAEVTEAASLAHNEPLRANDIFCPAGFCVFEEPLVVPDLDPDTGEEADDLWVHVRAMGWHVHDHIANIATNKVGMGVSIFFYTTRDDYEEGYYQALKDSGRPVPYEPEAVDEGFLPIEVLPWTFDVPWDTRHSIGYIPGTVPNFVAFQRRWFYAFHRLMWQTIIVHRKEKLPRQQRRRLERTTEGRKELLDYTVLRLRRIVDPTAQPTYSGTGRKLDHRVLARGYWMYAHLKAEGGPTYLTEEQMTAQYGAVPERGGLKNPANHRWVWIEPAWRGPADGPIGAMEAATVVVR